MKDLPLRTLLLLTAILVAIIVPFCLFGDAVDAWTESLIAHADAHRQTTGLLLALLLASDIVMPVPSSLASTACGMTLGFFGGFAASFAGMTASAVAGHAIGRYASESARRLIGRRESDTLESFQRRQGIWLLLALRPVPVLAEASVVFSGLSREPFLRVFGVTALGNAMVSLVYAALGAWGRSTNAFLAAFVASMLLTGGLYALMRRTPRVTSEEGATDGP